MDIDDLTAHRRAERRTQNLHVSRQDDQIDVILLDQFQNLTLLLCFRRSSHREMMERNLVGIGQRFEIRMIGYDKWDFDTQLLDALTEKQIIKTMTDFGNHDKNSRFGSQRRELEIHTHFLSDAFERPSQFLETQFLSRGF